MIRKKEDLHNTYIRNDKGELRDLYLNVCSGFGLHSFSDGFGAHFYDTEFIQCDEYSMPDSEGILQRSVEINDDFVELTADDLKIEKPFLQTGEDFEHSKTLNFIRDRLVEVYGESKNLDYMHKLNNAIAFVGDMENEKAVCGSLRSRDGARIESASECLSKVASKVLDSMQKDKPKRTREGYVKVEFNSAWEAIQRYEISDDLYYCASSIPTYEKMKSGNMKNLLDCSMPIKLYRRVEVEVSERDEFIEEAMKFTSFNNQQLLGQMFDSGKFKLIN